MSIRTGDWGRFPGDNKPGSILIGSPERRGEEEAVEADVGIKVGPGVEKSAAGGADPA